MQEGAITIVAQSGHPTVGTVGTQNMLTREGGEEGQKSNFNIFRQGAWILWQTPDLSGTRLTSKGIQVYNPQG